MQDPRRMSRWLLRSGRDFPSEWTKYFCKTETRISTCSRRIENLWIFEVEFRENLVPRIFESEMNFSPTVRYREGREKWSDVNVA